MKFIGGSASDVFNLGAGTLDALAGHLYLDSGDDFSDTGFDSVSLADQASVGNHIYNIEAPAFDTVEVSRANFDVVADDFPSFALSAGVGNDTFNISPTAKDLVGLIGKFFTLDGGGGSNVLNINDQNTNSTGNFFMGSDYFESDVIIGTQGFSGPHIDSNEMQSIVFNGSNTRNQITVQKVFSGSSITMNAGIGVNEVTVGGPFFGIPPGGGLDEINGLVTVVGTDAGFTSLTLDDTESTSTTGRTLLVQRDRVQWGFNQVDFLDIQALVLDGANRGNAFAVSSTPVGLLTTINAGSHADAVHAGGTLVGDVSPIQGPLVVNGFINGNTTFTVFDQSNSGQQTYTATTTGTTLQIARSGGFLASCTHLRSVLLKGGSENDQYIVNAPNLIPVTLAGGSGQNTLTGPANGIHIVTWNITGAGGGKIGKNLTFSGMHDLVGSTSTDLFQIGPAGSIAGIIDGAGSDNELNYSVETGPVILNVQNQTAPQLHGGAPGAWGNIQVFIGSKSAGDTLIGPDLDTTWFIGHVNAGFAQGTAFRFSFTGFENLTGGSGLDVFRFISLGQVTGNIDGGAAPTHQGNWLDYSGLGTAVQVNLQTGSATEVGGKVSNVQNVYGSNGGSTLTGNAQGNILIGGAGSDLLTGGTGPSLLIGATGADSIAGGSAGDILIGDTTAFDLVTLGDVRALMGILAEWQSTDSYATRFTDINTGSGGGLNGAFRLFFGTSVKDDSAADVLTALPTSTGLDWFFQGAGDTLHNIESGEHINNNTPAALADRTVTVTGHRATVGGIITDPNRKDTFTLVIDWGDGSPADTYVFPAGLNGRKIAVWHWYKHPGSYTIHAFWTDPTGPGNSADLAATVSS